MAAGSPSMAHAFWAPCAVLLCLVVAAQAGIPDRGPPSIPPSSVHGSCCPVVPWPWRGTYSLLRLTRAPLQATLWCKTAPSISTVGLSSLLDATHGIS